MVTEVTREVLEVDCLIVGGGAAGLATAIRLAERVKAETRRDLSETTILLIEKGDRPGAHSLSGAVLDPVFLRELLPDAEADGAPLGSPVSGDEIRYLTPTGSFRIPVTPPSMSHHGGRVISLGRLVAWMAGEAEKRGVEVMTGFAGREVLFDGDRVIGVRTGDKGIDKHGRQKPNFEAGVDIHAKVTVFAEGPRGSLARDLIAARGLDRGRDPQIYSLGVKELWKLPAGRATPGAVVHTMGWPLPASVFGGSFIYHLDAEHVVVGLVMSLDYGDPRFDPQMEFQRLKTHPLVRSLLEGGELVRYGAKVIPEGGYHAMPRPYTAGALLAGDSAGFLNVARLKGIHLAMKSGMLAAETVVDALVAGDTSESALAAYERRLADSPVHRELHANRNFRAAFTKGLWSGIANAGMLMVSGGRHPAKARPYEPDRHTLKKLAMLNGRAAPAPLAFDGKYLLDRDNDVYYSGTQHEEDQPSHLLVPDPDLCRTRCREEYGNPCERFCPAHVYEMAPDEERGGTRLILHPTNCVHCKTCDLMDPYLNITWVPPEGGGGPDYVDM